MRTILFSVAVIALIPTPALAYIDPGSGSLLWQVIVSAILGSLFVVRHQIARLVSYLRSLFS